MSAGTLYAELSWSETEGLGFLHAANGAASGSHKERAARAVVAAAAADGYRAVTAGSCGNYAMAIAAAAADTGMRAVVVVPAGWGHSGRGPRRWGAEVVLVDGNYEDAVATSRAIAQQGVFADGNVDGPYARHAQGALAVLVDDLAELLDQPPTAIWVPLGNGTTTTAIGAACLGRGWPTRLVGVTSRGNNSVAASWPGPVHRTIPPGDLRPTPVNEPLVNWEALHGQPAMDAIRASRGTVLALSDAELRSAQHLGWPVHGASPSATAGVAGYALSGHDFADLPGVHVAVLTDRTIARRDGKAGEGCA